MCMQTPHEKQGKRGRQVVEQSLVQVGDAGGGLLRLVAACGGRWMLVEANEGHLRLVPVPTGMYGALR